MKCETVQSSFKLCVVFLHLSLVSTPQPPLPRCISTTQSALLFSLWGHRHAVLIYAPALATPLTSRRPALYQHNKHMNLFMQLETRTTCLQKGFQRFPVISPKLTCFFLKKPRLSQLGMYMSWFGSNTWASRPSISVVSSLRQGACRKRQQIHVSASLMCFFSELLSPFDKKDFYLVWILGRCCR